MGNSLLFCSMFNNYSSHIYNITRYYGSQLVEQKVYYFVPGYYMLHVCVYVCATSTLIKI